MKAGFKKRLPLSTIFVAVLVLAGIADFFGDVAEGAKPIAINPIRLQIMKDALHSMYFQQNGTVVDNQTVDSLFLPEILERYENSKFYRSFVIAFQFGVLPRLTMVVTRDCDPRRIPRDPWNKSMTWHYLKNFTFQSYYDRHLINSNSVDKTNKLCDYRQGLQCKPVPGNPHNSKCACPEGSTRTHINRPKPGTPSEPPKYKCLLNINSTCSLIDLDHGNDPTHSALASNMYHLMFNLERPLACVPGSQCRFKDTDLTTPRCYDNNDGPFYPPPPSNGVSNTTWTLELGSNCSIGLYADPGSCEVNTNNKYGVLPGLTCYNFGPRKSDNRDLLPGDHREGFCAPEYGKYGLVSVATSANGQLQFHPLFFPYIHPRNINLTGPDLLSFYTKFLDQVHRKLFLEGVQRENGQDCDFAATRRFQSAFLYYYMLTINDIPPPTEDDFNADAANSTALEEKLEEIVGLANDTSKGICRVYPYYHKESPTNDNPELVKALNCQFGTGKCVPGGWDSRFDSHANEVAAFLDSVSLIEIAQLREEVEYDEEILRDNPETFCGPIETFFRMSHLHETPLMGGECREGFLCYFDFGDYQKGLYDADCTLDTSLTLNASCHEGRDGIQYGMCEGKELEKRIEECIPAIETVSNLGLGDPCDYNGERLLRSWIKYRKDGEANKYKVLVVAERAKKDTSKPLFCDAKKLAECKPENVCGCVESTSPRVDVEDTGEEISSDFCYITRGSCTGIDLSTLVPLLPDEHVKAKEDYGEKAPGNYCGEDSNLCWNLDEERQICTGKKDEEERKEEAGAVDIHGQSGGNWIYLVATLFMMQI